MIQDHFIAGMFIFAVIAGIVAGVVIEIRRMMDDRAMRLYEEGKDAYFDGDKLNPRWPRAKREGYRDHAIMERNFG